MYVIFNIVECDYNGKTYNPGDSFNSTDGCNTWLVHSALPFWRDFT